MRVINAIPNMAGSFIWQSPLRDDLPEDRQEGVEINFTRTATGKDAALRRLAVQLADLHETWIHPADDPAGDWLIHLDQLRQRFPPLREQQWMEGKRRVTPVFDVVQITSGSGEPRPSGVVSFILNREKSRRSSWRAFVQRRLSGAIEMKPGFFGFTIDLRKIFRRG